MPPTTSSSSSSSTSSSDLFSSSIARIWVVRHGERLDEADRLAWYQQCVSMPNNRWHDPPLTDRGHKQAAHAAAMLLRFISTSPSTRYQNNNNNSNNNNNNNNHDNQLINEVENRKEKELENRLEKEMMDDIEAGMIGFNRNASVKAVDREDRDTESKEESLSNENKLTISTIYSSPLLRVMQTAQMFSSAYQLPIQPVAALAAPAAAIQERHIEASDIFLPHKELQKRCPHVINILPWTPEIHSNDYQFIDWCESLVKQYPQQRDFILVTHREAIRDLMRHCGRVLKIVPYCQIVQFDYDRLTKKWTPNEFITPPQNC